MDRDTVLIVDDIEINREILVEILQDDYDIMQATNGFEAVDLVVQNSQRISLVLLDIMMPEMDGYEVLEVLKASGYIGMIPVIIITASGGDDNEIRCLQLGAADFVSKPFNSDIVKCRVAAQVELKKHRMHLEELVEDGVQTVLKVRESMIDLLASIIEYRHIESGQHVKRTRNMAETLIGHIVRSGMETELTASDIIIIPKAVPLHDVGKISTPDHILLKPGKLTAEEFKIIEQHTVTGASIIDTMKDIEEPEYIKCCRDICLHHHERWDGKGYPCGLKGNDIPYAARIMSIVDVYDALTNQRVYKPAFSHEEALDILKKGSGEMFDPSLIEVFLEHHESFREDKGE